MIFLTSTHSLTKYNQLGTLYTQKGIPRREVVERTEAVTIFYTINLYIKVDTNEFIQ